MNLTVRTSDELTPEIKAFIVKYHYLHSCPMAVKFIFTAHDDENNLVGVALVTHFSRFQSKAKYKDCLELSRVVLLDHAPKNSESFLLGHILRHLKQNTNLKGLVSYADPTVGHQGTIYKASNFELIGTSSQSYHYIGPDGKWINKKGVWDKAKKSGLRESEFAKTQGYVKVTEQRKFIYFYEFVDGYLEKLKASNFDIDEVLTKKAYYHKASNRWVAHVKTKNSKQFLGYYKTEEAAFDACDNFEKEFHGKKYKSSYHAEEVFDYESKPENFDPALHAVVKIGPRFFLIDREFISYVSERRWNTFSTYMTHSNSFADNRFFHRFVMSAKDGYIVDHINGMKNDNRKINLRCVQHSLNNHNVDRRKSHEGFYGVRLNKGKYEANVTFNYKSYYLGRFETAEEAAKSYDERVVSLYGKEARTNFPIENYVLPSEPEVKSLELRSFKLSKKKKCLSDGCFISFYSSNFDFCERCRLKQTRREIAAFEGREVKKYKERVAKASEFCQIENCKNPVSARNLCATHYYHERKKEDPSYRADKPKKIYACTYAGCEAQYQHKENLCLVHYNEKHGIIPGPRTGRPSNGKVDCKQCGAVGVATQPSCLCSKCYRRNYMAAKRSADKDYGKKKSEP